MAKYLVLIAVLFWALGAWGEEWAVDVTGDASDMIWTVPANDMVLIIPVHECIETVICGDAKTTNGARCVRLTVCGEPIR